MNVLNLKFGVRAIRNHTIVQLKFHDFNVNILCVTKNFQHDPRNARAELRM